jgi:hypothetical protein
MKVFSIIFRNEEVAMTGSKASKQCANREGNLCKIAVPAVDCNHCLDEVVKPAVRKLIAEEPERALALGGMQSSSPSFFRRLWSAQ